MIKYQLVMVTRDRNGVPQHKVSKLYNSVADLFANPAFAEYIQKHFSGMTMRIQAVTVADENV